MKAELVIESVWKAIKTRAPEPRLIFHSDRGSQFCSTRLRNIKSIKALVKKEIAGIMLVLKVFLEL